MPIPAGPAPTLPDWAPTREQVAAYVPRRTIIGTTSGHGQSSETWSDLTYPTGVSVDSLIADACNWVLLATGELHETLTAQATVVASRWAAGHAELGYPDNRDDLQDVRLLLEQATADRKLLAAANTALTGDDPSTAADDVLPDVWWPTVESSTG